MSQTQEALYKINFALACNAEKLLERLGIDLDEYIVTDEYIRGPAPCHGGDNHTAWILYKSDHPNWKCWTHHCEEEYGSNLVSLIKLVEDCSFEKARKKAVEFIDNNHTDIDIINFKPKKAKIDYWNEHRNPMKYFSESLLSRLELADKFAHARKINIDMLNDYDIGIAKEGKMSGRLVVPIRNIDSKIIGFTARRTNEEDSPKWLHYPSSREGFRTSNHLFNIDRAFKYNCDTNKNTYILTEGPFDTLKFEEGGIHTSVCTLGNHVSSGQIEILRQIGASNIIIAYDSDNAGREGAERARKKLEKNLFSVCIIDIGDAFPYWPESLGALDWGSPYVEPKYIRDILLNLWKNRSKE